MARVMIGAMLGQSMPSFWLGLDVHPLLRRDPALDAGVGARALSQTAFRGKNRRVSSDQLARTQSDIC